MRNIFRTTWLSSLMVLLPVSSVLAEGDWEVTPASERALQKGLAWLARNQGPTRTRGRLSFLAYVKTFQRKKEH